MSDRALETDQFVQEDELFCVLSPSTPFAEKVKYVPFAAIEPHKIVAKHPGVREFGMLDQIGISEAQRVAMNEEQWIDIGANPLHRLVVYVCVSRCTALLPFLSREMRQRKGIRHLVSLRFGS
jgi:hypothetical protein